MLTTARLWIRPFTLADVPDATAAVGLLMDSDERNREWIDRLGVDHQREHGYAYWQCRDKDTGRLLGFCGLREHDLGASLGNAFAEPARGNGYAKEAAGAVVAWGLANIGAERLYASVRPPNPASCKVLEHAGMTLVREYVEVRRRSRSALDLRSSGSPAVAADALSGGPTPEPAAVRRLVG